MDLYTIKRMPEFDLWFESIKDGLTRIRLAKRLDKAQRGLLGDVESVGEGVFEMREFFGPGWRLYYVERKSALIVMLGGGTKGTQSRDVKHAKELARALRNDEEDQS